MAVESAADRLIYFNTDEFGVSATYDGSTTVKGLIDRRYIEALGGEAEHPVFICREADISGVVHGKTLVANSTSYTVRGVQPDGSGMILLVLRET